MIKIDVDGQKLFHSYIVNSSCYSWKYSQDFGICKACGENRSTKLSEINLMINTNSFEIWIYRRLWMNIFKSTFFNLFKFPKAQNIFLKKSLNRHFTSNWHWEIIDEIIFVPKYCDSPFEIVLLSISSKSPPVESQ